MREIVPNLHPETAELSSDTFEQALKIKINLADFNQRHAISLLPTLATLSGTA